AKYRSFGEMLASDPKFSDRKRNRDNDYSHTAKRSDLEDEVRKIFQAQRCFGNARATEELERDFHDKAFSQRPRQNSEDKVGNCPFEPDHKRTTKRASPRQSAHRGCPWGRVLVAARGDWPSTEKIWRAEELYLQGIAQGPRS